MIAPARDATGLCSVVLAAGASRRLGRPKQLLPHGGVPLVRAIALVLLGAPSIGRVGVVTGSEHEAVEAAVAGLATDVLANTAWEEGMASSVRTAVAWAVSVGAEGLLIALVDQVRLSVEHVEALALAWRTGTVASASGYGGTVGVPALFDKRAFGALLALEGDRVGAKVFRGREDVAIVPWEDGLVDIDTPDDVRAGLPSA